MSHFDDIYIVRVYSTICILESRYISENTIYNMKFTTPDRDLLPCYPHVRVLCFHTISSLHINYVYNT